MREDNFCTNLGHGDGQMDTPYGLCVDKHNNVLVYDARNIRIEQFTLEGAFTGKTSSNIQFGLSWSVTPMLDDRILVTGFRGKEVYILKWTSISESNNQFFKSKPLANIFEFYYFINLRKIVTCHLS